MVRIKRDASNKRWTTQAFTVLVLLFITSIFLGTIALFTFMMTADVSLQDGVGTTPGDQTTNNNDNTNSIRSNWRQVYKEGSKTLRDWKQMGLEKNKSISYPGVDEEIARILRSARAEIDAETAAQLPKWADVVSQYGDKPIIHGLENCERYRQQVKPEDRMIGPAGIFNTGTNLFFQVEKENCVIKEAALSKSHSEPRKNGIRYQVPWGKHNPVKTHRFHNVAAAWGAGIKQDDVMPFVLIKDPYHWMGSECRHEYLLRWDHDESHCPNVIDSTVTDRYAPIPVYSKYAKSEEHYDSLVDVWNTWYNEWEEQNFPMIQTRFEDLVFHGEEVLKAACECVGGVFAEDFVFIERNAKEDLPLNAGANGLVKTLIQYGNSKNRLHGFTDREVLYAGENLDAALMEKFGYVPPPLP